LHLRGYGKRRGLLGRSFDDNNKKSLLLASRSAFEARVGRAKRDLGGVADLPATSNDLRRRMVELRRLIGVLPEAERTHRLGLRANVVLPKKDSKGERDVRRFRGVLLEDSVWVPVGVLQELWDRDGCFVRATSNLCATKQYFPVR